MPVGRPFSATNPGNPKGRPPAAIDVAALAREHGPRCIEVLAEMLEDPDRKVRGFAALALLDRGFGKPRQVLETDGLQSIQLMHLSAARSISERLRATLDAGTTPSPMIEGEPVRTAERQRRNGSSKGPNAQLPHPIEPAME
jgi:hypothetical protein